MQSPFVFNVIDGRLTRISIDPPQGCGDWRVTTPDSRIVPTTRFAHYLELPPTLVGDKLLTFTSENYSAQLLCRFTWNPNAEGADREALKREPHAEDSSTRVPATRHPADESDERDESDEWNEDQSKASDMDQLLKSNTSDSGYESDAGEEIGARHESGAEVENEDLQAALPELPHHDTVQAQKETTPEPPLDKTLDSTEKLLRELRFNEEERKWRRVGTINDYDALLAKYPFAEWKWGGTYNNLNPMTLSILNWNRGVRVAFKHFYPQGDNGGALILGNAVWTRGTDDEETKNCKNADGSPGFYHRYVNADFTPRSSNGLGGLAIWVKRR